MSVTLSEYQEGDTVAVTLVGTRKSSAYGAVLALNVDTEDEFNISDGSYIANAVVDHYLVERPKPEFKPGELLRTERGDTWVVLGGGLTRIVLGADGLAYPNPFTTYLDGLLSANSVERLKVVPA